MDDHKMNIPLNINGLKKNLSIRKGESLLDALRGASYFSVKRGCDTGDCGVCAVLFNGKPVRSCKILAEESEGQEITTVEGLSQDKKLHPIQLAFVETGAIQCGFCTPAQILVAKTLLDQIPDPTESEVREALSSVLCRCTGYVRTVDAILRAAAYIRGEHVKPVAIPECKLHGDVKGFTLPEEYYRRGEITRPLPPLVVTPLEMEDTWVVGKPEVKVDAKKLVQGRPVFTDDFHVEGMLYGALLTSPHAHARIKEPHQGDRHQPGKGTSRCPCCTNP
jgi:putative selenate reductase molybdopterin-binding subunit